MADFESTVSRRDALLVKRLGAQGAFVPNLGSRVDGIYLIIESGVQVQSEFGDGVVTQTLVTARKSDLGEIQPGDKFENSGKFYTVKRILQDDGNILTAVVV